MPVSLILIGVSSELRPNFFEKRLELGKEIVDPNGLTSALLC